MKEILITSSVLIAVILLARRLFRGKVSQKLIYAAWLLVALRLLVPIQIGQSKYSITTFTEKIESQSKPIQQVQEVLREPVAGPSRAELYEQLLNEYIQQSADPALPEAQKPITPEIQEQINQQVEERITAPTLSELLTTVWIAGMGVMAVWFITTNLLYLYRAKQGAVPFNEIKSPATVRVSSNVPTPCLVGIFRPVIYLTPASTENGHALNHVLTHELTHLRHWDHIWSLIRCVCLCVYWFNPLVWVAAHQSRRDCELACDESALKKLGDSERIAYGQTLLATVTQSMSPTHLIETATAMNETKKQLKERVSFIVRKPRNILIAAVCMILIAAITAGCTFMGGKVAEPNNTEPVVKDPSGNTEPIPSTESTEPPPSQPTVTPHPSDPAPPSTVSPPVTLSAEETQALKSAEALISDYMWYKAVGICCDFEPVSQDMSRFLTAEQQAEYTSFQYLLKCCHSAQEVRAHIDSRFDPSLLLRGYPDDKLFTDEQGNLYLIVLPTEYNCYRHITLTEFSDDHIIASACIYDEYGCWRSETFTMSRVSEDFVITQIVGTNTAPETPSRVPPMSSADYRSATLELIEKKYGISYVEFLYAGNEIVRSIIEEYDPQNVQTMDLAARDTVAMYQRILYIDHDNTVMMHFPIFSLKDSSEIFGGYYIREFTIPNEENLQHNAYQWFFEELSQTADGFYADAYANLLTDSLFQDPDMFIHHLSECSENSISNIAGLIAYNLNSDEYNTYRQLLEHLRTQYISLDRPTIQEENTITLLLAPINP